MAKRRKPTAKTHRKGKSHAAAPEKAGQLEATNEGLFRKEYIEQARKLAVLGHIDREMAQYFEVSIRTVENWKAKYPAFANALKVGKETPDERVVRALYNRAMGYSFDSEELFVDREGREHRMPTIKHIPPDTTAQIFWLKNRRPDEWRDRQEINHTLTTAEDLAAARRRAQERHVVSEQAPVKADSQAEPEAA